MEVEDTPGAASASDQKENEQAVVEPVEKTEKELVVDKLNELKKLYEDQLISDKEYEQLKENLLKKLSELL